MPFESQQKIEYLSTCLIIKSLECIMNKNFLKAHVLLQKIFEINLQCADAYFIQSKYLNYIGEKQKSQKFLSIAAYRNPGMHIYNFAQEKAFKVLLEIYTKAKTYQLNFFNQSLLYDTKYAKIFLQVCHYNKLQRYFRRLYIKYYMNGSQSHKKQYYKLKIHNKYINILYQLGKYDQAIQLCLQELQIFPNCNTAYEYLTYFYCLIGNYQQAKQYYKKITNNQIKYIYYSKIGKYEQALSQLDKKKQTDCPIYKFRLTIMLLLKIINNYKTTNQISITNKEKSQLYKNLINCATKFQNLQACNEYGIQLNNVYYSKKQINYCKLYFMLIKQWLQIIIQQKLQHWIILESVLIQLNNYIIEGELKKTKYSKKLYEIFRKLYNQQKKNTKMYNLMNKYFEFPKINKNNQSQSRVKIVHILKIIVSVILIMSFGILIYCFSQSTTKIRNENNNMDLDSKYFSINNMTTFQKNDFQF